VGERWAFLGRGVRAAGLVHQSVLEWTV